MQLKCYQQTWHIIKCPILISDQIYISVKYSDQKQCQGGKDLFHHKGYNCLSRKDRTEFEVETMKELYLLTYTLMLSQLLEPRTTCPRNGTTRSGQDPPIELTVETTPPPYMPPDQSDLGHACFRWLQLRPTGTQGTHCIGNAYSQMCYTSVSVVWKKVKYREIFNYLLKLAALTSD